ncbi:hypothetical protein F471_03706 [Pseudomonas sp. URMO17WK12:I1]|nr:hypothetical protein F471_03706 [Pseudomonas sp. URMO17WK12:I1]
MAHQDVAKLMSYGESLADFSLVWVIADDWQTFRVKIAIPARANVS